MLGRWNGEIRLAARMHDFLSTVVVLPEAQAGECGVREMTVLLEAEECCIDNERDLVNCSYTAQRFHCSDR